MVKHDYYSYALDNENHLICAEGAEKGRDYFCPSCGEKMILRKGTIRRPHFAHKVNTEHCSYESYLHIIAKKQICKCFNESTRFMISFKAKDICAVTDCPLGANNPCSWDTSREYSLKQYYNKCIEEVQVDSFRTDLLLCPINKKHPPIFIEIWVTHKSTQSKLNSRNKIIEIKIESESDIQQIIETQSIIEYSDKIAFYNFKGDTFKIPEEELQTVKHQFWINDRGWFQFSRINRIFDEGTAPKCLSPNPPEIANSLFLIESNHEISEAFAFQKLSESGLDIKYCTMCKFYRYNDFYERCMCILYKSKGTNQFPMLSKAMVCPCYKQLDFLPDGMIDFNKECRITIRKNNIPTKK